MLDPTKRFTLSLPRVVDIYPDHAVTTRFYVVPVTPHVALDAQGKPAVSLLLYGKKQGSEFKLMGGSFTVTTDMGLMEQESALLRQLLAERVTPPALVELTSPDWRQGKVTVHLAPGLVVEGKPSLLGTNQATLLLNLNAASAASLSQAWQEGLPQATICYELQTTAAQQATLASTTATDHAEEDAAHHTETTTSSGVHVNIVSAVAYPITLEGALCLSPAMIAENQQTIRL